MRFFYESPVPFKPTPTQLRLALHNKRALILFDDLDLDRTDVEILLDALPNCPFILAASERHLWGEGRLMVLRGFPLEDALALLARELARPLTAEEQQLAPVLCSLLDGHPLHLLQVASLIRDRGYSLPELTRELLNDEPHQALAAQITNSLSELERQLTGLLAAVDGAPLAAEHLAALTGLSDPAPVLERLLNHHLIQGHSPDYSLAGDWGQIWDLSPVREQMLSYLAGWAEQHQESPGRLLENVEPILQLLTWAASNGRWNEILRLARAIEGVLILSGRWGIWETVLQQALQAASAAGNQAAQAWAWHQLGTRALCLEDTAAARPALEQALKLRESLGDWAGAAITRHNLNLLLPPPEGQTAAPHAAPHSPVSSPSSAPSLLELIVTAGLIGGLLSLIVLLFALGGLQLPFLQRAENTPSPSISNIVFVTASPTPAVTFTPFPAPTLAVSGTATSPAGEPTSPATPVSSPTLTATQAVPSPGSPAACQPPPDWLIYVAQAGDTLLSVAERTNATIFDLQRANCLDSFTFQPGQVIYVPALPPTSTVISSPTPQRSFSTPTATPVRLQPEITDISPRSGNVGAEVVIRIEGNNFEVNSANFRVELIGETIGVTLRLGGLRTATAFEAITPSTLPAGVYDLFVINPDNQVSVLPAAYEVVGLPPTATPEPLALLSPSRLEFAEQLVDTTGPAQTVLLTNIGTADLSLSSINLTGTNPADFLLNHNCPAVLAPDNSCTITLLFRPTAAGDRHARLTIGSNSRGSPHVTPLHGVGDPGQPDLIVALLEISGSVTFDEAENARLPIRLVIKNEGDGPAGLFKVATTYTYTGSDSAEVTAAAAFEANDTSQVDPAGGVYPLTRNPLTAGLEVTFEGIVIFASGQYTSTVFLKAAADSCIDEPEQPEECRVSESNENNNESQPAPVELPVVN